MGETDQQLRCKPAPQGTALLQLSDRIVPDCIGPADRMVGEGEDTALHPAGKPGRRILAYPRRHGFSNFRCSLKKGRTKSWNLNATLLVWVPG